MTYSIRSAAKLGVPWPAAQGSEGLEWDQYDGIRLPPAQPAPKQLLSAVPVCMNSLRAQFFLKLAPNQGCSKLEIHEMSVQGLAEPPAMEHSMAYHPHLNRRLVES